MSRRDASHDLRHRSSLFSCLFFVAIAAGSTGCADDTSGPHPGADASTADGASGGGRWLAVVGSDYKTAAVSAVDPASGQVVASAFLHSGSKVGAGGTALSGDVVLAQTPTAAGDLVVIDRATAVLTFVSPGTWQIAHQVSVATGFYANPQDYLQVTPTRAYVTRLGANPKPGAEPFDGGDDVLVLDLLHGTIAGRIALGGHATLPGARGSPGRMAFDGTRVWLPLASMAPDFKAMGPGRIVGIDPTTDQIVRVIEAPSARNCWTVRRVPGTTRIAAVCSGSFSEPANQAKTSQLLVFDSTGTASVADVLVGAESLPGGRPFGRELAFVDAQHGFVLTAGDFATKTPDALWRVDADSGAAQLVTHGGEAFAVSGLYADVGRSTLWLGERTRPAGDLRRFQVTPGGLAELPAVASNPGGLGAVEIASF